MGQNLVLCAQLWWFRKGPQDFPTSKMLLSLFVMANIVLALAIDKLVNGQSAVQMLPLELLSYVLLAVFVGIVLWFTNLSTRLSQALTAFYGVELVANSAALAIIAIATPLQLTNLMGLFALILYFWTLAVYSYVFRHTLSISIGAGVLVAVTFEVLRLMILFAFFKQA